MTSNAKHSSLDRIYEQLMSAYSNENLSRISTSLIKCYRRGDQAYLEQVRNYLYPYLNIDSMQLNKLFSRLIRIYHPDRLGHYLKKIERCYTLNDVETLHELLHLIKVCDIPPIESRQINIDMDIWSSMDVEFWYDEKDFDRIFDPAEFEPGQTSTFSFEEELGKYRDILEVMREREGLSDQEFGQHQLAYLQDDLDLSSSGLNDLNGIEYCINLKSLDLSGNDLTEIVPLGYLYNIEELYLSGNRIDSVRALHRMNALKILDISHNEIRDITDITGLSGLEFVNLTGNPVPREQVEMLRGSGIVTLF
jgi:hypothetical protein